MPTWFAQVTACGALVSRAITWTRIWAVWLTGSSSLMPLDFAVELNTAVADRLDDGQKLALADEVQGLAGRRG